MQSVSPRQYIEIFHLLFLDQLGRKLDRKLYALKGGCNLRFYFNSIRYSEDIDLDVKTIAKDTLRKKVNTILTSTPFISILRARKIQINNISEAKQSDTTQRWKISIITPTTTLPLNTKIEFSRRGLNEGVLFEPASPLLIHAYQLPLITLNHYNVKAAILQKINALIFRAQTQTRDIFDLYHLFTYYDKSKSPLKIAKSDINQAKLNAKSLSFEDFKSQVISYLPDEYKNQFGSLSCWTNMVNTVIEKLDNAL